MVAARRVTVGLCSTWPHQQRQNTRSPARRISTCPYRSPSGVRRDPQSASWLANGTRLLRALQDELRGDYTIEPSGHFSLLAVD